MTARSAARHGVVSGIRLCRQCWGERLEFTRSGYFLRDIIEGASVAATGKSCPPEKSDVQHGDGGGNAVRQDDAIHVTSAIVPDPGEYAAYITEILSTRHLTNRGVFATRLERKLSDFLGVPYLALCTNGTMALLLALRVARLQGKEVITTPFSYVASVSALLWEGCTPVFADIEEETLCIDPRKLEGALSDDTAGVLPVHIYGNACDVDGIGRFAGSHGLQVVYDAAQAFGSTYEGRSLLSFGDFSTASFHATKVFHTVEGGCVVARTKEAHDELNLMRAFGHIGDTHYSLGINAKVTEPHAAMGLCLLDRVRENIAGRKLVSEMYDARMPSGGLRKPALRAGLSYNYAYYPVVFDTEKAMRRALDGLRGENVFPRRYFYPALNTLPYLTRRQACPVAESIAARVLALPLYAELQESTVERIMRIIVHALG